MDGENPAREVVDPEVRAYVYSLVSALGGTGADEDGRYVLGDDALACLKDLKRWLKLYDEKLNRLDVARCLAEANLVNGDLLEILAAWPEDATRNKLKLKTAVACLELLVPLTWPIEKNDLQMTVNHHRHTPYLQLAQIAYKRSILNHETAKILRTVVRVGLPSIAQPSRERSSRDEGIIKLILYFIRNVAMISIPPKIYDDGDESEVSRSATIDAFHHQDIFHLLLTISSGTGDDFNTQDIVVMEVLFHLLKGVDIEKLFMTESQSTMRKTDELRALLDKEAGMLRGYARNAPTRHNRFGTMIWIKRDDHRVSAVSGQDVLLNNQRSLAKIDETKKWKKAKPRSSKIDSPQNDFDTPVPLTASATRHLRAFVEAFLDSAFNPLFGHIRKAIEREAERVLDTHPRQFFFLVSWFLEAERVRRKVARTAQKENPGTEEVEADSFAIIANVLTQETFITLNRFMQESYDMKAWDDLNAGMRCFTQILLTIQEMSESPLEEDQTIAENIQARIFYEETTHDRIVAIVRNYTNQGFGYLNACTELAHVHLRVLEHYSKQNVEMQVRSRRRARTKKRASKSNGNDSEGQDDEEGEGSDSEDEDVAKAQRATNDRKFDFKRFAAKFVTQACVNTFVALTRYYQDLTLDQLKHAHRFFHRVAFKMDMSVMLFRVDIISLFHKMVKGPGGLDPASPTHGEWDELVRQVIKKMVRKIGDRPQLVVEMLFSKINATAHYLEFGYEKQTASTKPRAPAELEVKPGMERSEQIGVAVALLLSQDKKDAIDWVKAKLTSAISERKAWESEAAAMQSIEQSEDPVDKPIESKAPSIIITADHEARRIAMFKDNKLRLLMTLVGFERLGVDDEADSTWMIPSSAMSTQLSEALDAITGAEDNPPVFDDGRDADDFVRRKSAPKPRRAAFDDDSDGDGIIEDQEEEFLFPAGGPTIRKADALEKLKQKRRTRHQDEDEAEPLGEAEREARAEARRAADLERRRKIKSELFVHDSDDDDDEERDRIFFEEEEKRRRKQGSSLLQLLQANGNGAGDNKPTKSKKRKGGDEQGDARKSRKVLGGLESEDDDSGVLSLPAHSDPARTSADDEADTDTPLSSPHLVSSQENATKVGSHFVSTPATSPTAQNLRRDVDMLDIGVNGDSEDDDALVVKPAKRRARAGFIIESDSE
ncbi:MAG: Topoisomerase 1-associated factor 1 [Thelocarpon impressellum]|nr:MAG: Topoisomerase 1-associated factor 1 [Thelocarpon impressellum]